MTSKTTSPESYEVLNNKPFDAPLPFDGPSRVWIKAQTRKGNNNKNVTVPDVDLSGKWVIITGSNNGIGREAALQMAEWGANIILGCRNPPPHEYHPTIVVEECTRKARLAGYDMSQIEWWEIDMAKLATVDKFTERWLATGRPLDILCSNAGMGSNPGGHDIFLTKDGFEIIHQVNFLSHTQLILQLLPSLALASAPRIVCTTSCFHYPGIFDLTNFSCTRPGSTGADGVQFYMNNKLFYQTWLAELQRRLLQHSDYRHITINGVHPGYVNSGIWNLNSARGTWLTTAKETVLKLVATALAITPRQGCMAILHAATSDDAGPDPEMQGVGVKGGKGGGRYFNRVWEEEPMPHTLDRDCRLRVWRKVDEELSLKDKGLLDVLGLEGYE